MGAPFYLIWGIVALILQCAVLKLILPTLIVPNLLLLLVIFLGLHSQKIEGVVISFLLGLEFDLFGSHLLLGPFASSAVVVFIVVSILSKRLYFESSLTLFLVVLGNTLLFHLVSALITSQFVGIEPLLKILFRDTPFEAITTALMAPFVFQLLRKFGFGSEHSIRQSREPGWSV